MAPVLFPILETTEPQMQGSCHPIPEQPDCPKKKKEQTTVFKRKTSDLDQHHHREQRGAFQFPTNHFLYFIAPPFLVTLWSY